MSDQRNFHPYQAGVASVNGTAYTDDIESITPFRCGMGASKHYFHWSQESNEMPRKSKRIRQRKAANEHGDEDQKPAAIGFDRDVKPPGSIVQPTEADYIFGRGLAHIAQPGNALLHDTLDKFLPKYSAATTKSGKMKIVRLIHEKLSQKGRFIRKADDSESYYVVDVVTAREKISHGMRYRRRRKLKRKKAQQPSPETRSSVSEQNYDSSPADVSKDENVESQLDSFSIGSESVHSHTSWSSDRSFAQNQETGDKILSLFLILLTPLYLQDNN